MSQPPHEFWPWLDRETVDSILNDNWNKNIGIACMKDTREIVIPGQGKLVVVVGDRLAELGIESECCSCVAPVFRLNLERLRAIRAAMTDAIVQLLQNEAAETDPIREEVG